jgi:hypothetical protein
MTALYATMEAAEIPEEIIDTIARRAHKNSFNDGLKEAIETYMTPFERACRDRVPFADILNEHVEETFVHESYAWITVVLKLRTGTYVVYHYYRDGRDYDYILAEVAVENGKLQVMRFYYEFDDHIFHNFASYRKCSGINYIPFQFLADVAQLEDYTPIQEPTQQARWRHADDLTAWFSSHENRFMELVEDAE